MDRRTYGVVGVATLALAAFVAVTPAREEKREGKVAHAEHQEAFRACAKACSDCQRECDSCATHCAHLLGEGKKDHATTLMTCQDCANFCSSAAQIVSRMGPFSGLICDSCAEACSRCGKVCAKFPDDEHMKRCADECRKCEKACRDMLKHAPSGK
jgi:hypothetical protein